VGKMDRAQAALIRRKKAADPKVITYTRKATSATLTGWIGRGLQTNNPSTGLRLEISEREFFLTVEDMVTAGFDKPRKGDRLKVSGEDWVFEVLDPNTMQEPAFRYSDSERTFFRIHTELVKET
jgi:hypothetical protein